MRSFCSYCRGNTTEDFYGNCSACGAPKGVAQTIINPLTLGDSFPSYMQGSGSYYGYDTYRQFQENARLDFYEMQLSFLDVMKPEPQKKHAIPEFVRSLLRR